MDLTEKAKENAIELVGDPLYRKIDAANRTVDVHLKLRLHLADRKAAISMDEAIPGIRRAYDLGTGDEDGDRFKYQIQVSRNITLQLFNLRSEQVDDNPDATIEHREALLSQNGSTDGGVVAQLRTVEGKLTRKAAWVDLSFIVPKLGVDQVPALMVGLQASLVLTLPDAGQLDLFGDRPDSEPTDAGEADSLALENEADEPTSNTGNLPVQAHRYTCHHCGKVVATKTDGTLRKHTDPRTGQTCDASGTTPQPGALVTD